MIYVKLFLWGVITLALLPIALPLAAILILGYFSTRVYNAFWRCE